MTRVRPEASLVRVGSICELLNGRAFKPTDWTQDGLPIVRIQNLNNPEAPFNRFNGEVRQRFYIDNGALLFAWSGTPGTSFGAHIWNGGPAILNQHIFNVVFDEKRIDKKFFLFALNQKVGELIDKAHGGVGLQHVTKGVVEDTKIYLPPMREQRRIADLLTRAEGIVRLRREARQKAQAIIPALFLDMFGDPATNPRGWDVVTLGSVADVQGGLQVTRARESLALECPYLRVANVYRDRLDLSEIKTIRLTAQELERTRLEEGDLLIVEGHGNPQEVGRVAIWDAAIGECVHQNHLIRARVDKERLSPTFASAYLNSQSGRMSLLRAGKTTSGLSTISVKNVTSATVMLPPLAYQRAFVERADATRSIIAQQAAAFSKAEATFNALLGRVFSEGGIPSSAFAADAARRPESNSTTRPRVSATA